MQLWLVIMVHWESVQRVSEEFSIVFQRSLQSKLVLLSVFATCFQLGLAFLLSLSSVSFSSSLGSQPPLSGYCGEGCSERR